MKQKDLGLGNRVWKSFSQVNLKNAEQILLCGLDGKMTML
jgi:hypothetical protein